MFTLGPIPQTNARPTQQAIEVTWLEVGKPIEREMKGGESHAYQLNMVAGQYAYFLVKQIALDVVVKLYAPD